ncbi:MAG: DNA-binding response regulator [Acidimicrobiia bacterium]|nr:MAG: DNA-binding response regulator [Acidimicrobiia bacterium]
MNELILLVEDDPSVRDTTVIGLEGAGFKVVSAEDGPGGIERFDRVRPDLVILDVMLPGMDGLEACRRIRSRSSVPILLLTARGDPVDVVLGLEAGADDYVTKPFDLPVLVARIRAVMRRVKQGREPRTLRLGPLTVDLEGCRVWRDEEEIHLTPTEFKLLVELAGRPQQVFTREMLLERVWGYDYLGDSRLVDVTVQRLRSKIEEDPANPRLIRTVRGFGYRAGG